MNDKESTPGERLVAVGRWLNDDKESVQVIGDPWYDDHLLCFTAIFCGVEVEWMWSGAETFAAAKYANESPAARTDLEEMVEADLLPRLVDEAAEWGVK